MNLLFLGFIFIFIITRSSALYCIHTDNSFTFNFTKESSQDLKQIIKTLTETNQYEECCVLVSVSSENKQISVKFGTDAQSATEINLEVFVETLIELPRNNPIVNSAKTTNSIEFKCNSEDECDRRFVLDHMEWLMEVNHEKLISVIQPWFIAEDNNAGRNNNHQLLK